MTKEQQKAFIAELTGNIIADMNAAIDNDKVPANWDGFELRAWLAGRFEDANYCKMSPARQRAFKYTCYDKNL